MNNLAPTRDTQAIMPPAKRWRNKWRSIGVPQCMVTALPNSEAGAPGTYWAQVTWPSQDIAETKARECLDINAADGFGEDCIEYLGAYPSP